MQVDYLTVALVILCLAGAIALVALAYLFINLVKTLKETMAKVNPLLDEVSSITAELKPTVSKVEPMVDRVTLTIDAANLELMRVDQIMEDVNTITGNLAKASNQVDSVTSAPLDAIAGIANKVRSFVSPVAADGGPAASVAQVVNEGLAGVEGCVAEKQAELAERKVAADHAAAARDEAQSKVNSGAASLKGGVLNHIDTDTETD